MPKLDVVLGAVVACACAPSSPAPGVERPVAAAPSADECGALAATSCDLAPLDCDATRRWLERAAPEPSACASARAELEDAAGTLVDLGSIGQATLRVLTDVAGTRVATEDLVSRDGIPFASSALDGEQTVARCPGTAEVVGHAGSPGAEAFCARRGGTRHGPAVQWNEAGIASRIVTYRHGRIVHVEYEAATPALFVCPDGTTKQETSDDGDRVLACVDADGRRVGATVTFHANGRFSLELGSSQGVRTAPPER